MTKTKNNSAKNFFVTGGAGFIGSHIVDRLLETGHQVTVFDNFSTGKNLFIDHHSDNPRFKLFRGDVLDLKKLSSSMAGSDFVFHLSAHADVRSGFEDHNIDHVQNVEATQNVLEAMLKNNIRNIAFASTSSVYGDALIHPTPESQPFKPTSLYGATKAAGETYINAYSSYFDWDAYIFRFVSWTGERYTHGIVFDLMKKLEKNKEQIDLLSDGTPKKSSLYVKDGVEAIFKIIEKARDQINVFNIGHTQVLEIDKIVNIVFDELKVKPKKNYLGGDRGWKGDNNFVLLSAKELRKLGWKPKYSIEYGLRATVRYLKDHPELFNDKKD